MLTKAEQYLTDFNVVPTIAGLSLRLGISRDTVYEWAKQYPEFSDITARLAALQEENLIGHGLKGEYNATIAKLMLSARHDYVERTDHTTKGKELPTPIFGGNSVVSRDDSHPEDI